MVADMAGCGQRGQLGLAAVWVSSRLPCCTTMSCRKPKSSGATKLVAMWPALSLLEGRDAMADRREFAAIILGDRDLPASLHRAPDEIEFLLGRKCLATHGDV